MWSSPYPVRGANGGENRPSNIVPRADRFSQGQDRTGPEAEEQERSRSQASPEQQKTGQIRVQPKQQTQEESRPMAKGLLGKAYAPTFAIIGASIADAVLGFMVWRFSGYGELAIGAMIGAALFMGIVCIARYAPCSGEG